MEPATELGYKRQNIGGKYMVQQSVEQLTAQARETIVTGDEQASVDALLALAPAYASVAPVQAVDLLERACVFGTARVVSAAYEAFPEFVYESWALALALRCANEPVARLLLDRGVDLLGGVHQPTTYRALLPHEGTFTRFGLTRQSPTLFLNPMDPTVSTEVFEPFRDRANACLATPAYRKDTDLASTCDLVARLASEGCFDAVVFDDLLRAALVRAWHALRHEGQRDEAVAETCLAFASRMLEMYHMRGQSEQSLHRILGSLIVPKVHPRIVEFVCEVAPDVFLERLHELSWLKKEDGLVASMVGHLSPSIEEHNGTLLLLMAKNGRMPQLETMSSWENTLTSRNVDMAMEAASKAGHAEAATWLLARHPRRRNNDLQSTASDDLSELLL